MLPRSVALGWDLFEKGLNVATNAPRFYTANQVAAAVLLGGPVALIYTIRANFVALGQRRSAILTIIWGLLGSMALSASVYLLPDVPSSPFIVAQVVVARGIAEIFQPMPSGQYDFHSYWRVVVVGLVALPLSILLIGAPLFILIFLRNVQH